MKFFQIEYGSDDDRQTIKAGSKEPVRIGNHSYRKNDQEQFR